MEARNLKGPGDLWPLGVGEGTEEVNEMQKKYKWKKVAPKHKLQDDSGSFVP